MKIFIDNPKMQRIMDFEFIPFGNAYFGGTTGNRSYWQNKTSKSAAERAGGMRLWYNDCGAGSAARKPATAPGGDGCYDGIVLCQHGPNECASNLFEACVVKLYPTPQRFWPFVACYEGKAIGRDPRMDAEIPKQQMCSSGGAYMQSRSFNLPLFWGPFITSILPGVGIVACGSLIAPLIWPVSPLSMSKRLRTARRATRSSWSGRRVSGRRYSARRTRGRRTFWWVVNDQGQRAP